MEDGGSAHDLFTGLGVIYRKFITSSLTSIVNFRHFHIFLAPYSQLPTPYFYIKMLLPGPMDTPNLDRSKIFKVKIWCRKLGKSYQK